MLDVSVIIGSKSDLKVIESAEKYLDFFKISYEVKILSAHRQHDELVEYVKEIEQQSVKSIIACAGMAAHLPGVIAALTHIPVIGVPLNASCLNGVDALYSIVQMPKGIPVATMAIDKPGVINGIVFSAKIIALNDKKMMWRLEEFHKKGSKLP